MGQMGTLATLLVGGLLLLGLALVALWWSVRLRRESGLPSGRVQQSDMYGGLPGVEGKPLYSARYGLAGTPDYIVDTNHGPVPVEVKPGRTEEEPHESHLLQVLAYCLLLEERDGKYPPYGLLRYKTDTFRVDYNRETRSYLLSVLEEMRNAAQQPEVHRSHQVAGRCRACAYKGICEEALI
jgi:CRISPR-associated exonuclease Cas4